MDNQDKPAWVQVNEGLKRRIVADGERIMVVELLFAAGGGVPRHNHPHEQASYVVSGSVRFTKDGQEITLKAGQSLHFPSNVYHSASADEESLVVEIFSPPREDFRPKA